MTSYKVIVAPNKGQDFEPVVIVATTNGNLAHRIYNDRAAGLSRHRRLSLVKKEEGKQQEEILSMVSF